MAGPRQRGLTHDPLHGSRRSGQRAGPASSARPPCPARWPGRRLLSTARGSGARRCGSPAGRQPASSSPSASGGWCRAGTPQVAGAEGQGAAGGRGELPSAAVFHKNSNVWKQAGQTLQKGDLWTLELAGGSRRHLAGRAEKADIGDIKGDVSSCVTFLQYWGGVLSPFSVPGCCRDEATWAPAKCGVSMDVVTPRN